MVGRGRDSNKRAQKRPSGRKKKKSTPFDNDEYKRMEQWRVSTSTKAENKRENPVKNKSIGGRRKALQKYLRKVTTTKKLRRHIRELAKQIGQAKAAKGGSRARRRKAWTIWGARTVTEQRNDLLVINRVMKWAAKEVARQEKTNDNKRFVWQQSQKETFNPKSIASPRRLKRGTQRRVTFTSTIVTSIHVRPTTTDEKSLFTTEDNEERAKRDVFICPDLIEFTRGYRQQRRQLRKAMKKFHSADSTLQLTKAEQQRVNEDKWIKVTKSRKTTTLVPAEASPVQCSNGYEALADATIKSPPLQQSDTDEKASVPINKEKIQVVAPTPTGKQTTSTTRKARRLQKKMKRLQLSADEEAFFTECIAQAEDKRTEAAQQDKQNIWRRAEEQRVQRPKVKPSLKSTSREVSYRARNFFRGIVNDAMGNKKHVKFNLKRNSQQYFHAMDELPPGKWRDGSAKATPNHKRRDRKPHPSTQALQGPRDRAPKHSTTPKLTRTERRRLKKKNKRKEKRMELRKAATDLAALIVGGRRRTCHKAASKVTSRERGQQERATKAMRQPPK